jgi:hypothetical protein
MSKEFRSLVASPISEDARKRMWDFGIKPKEEVDIGDYEFHLVSMEGTPYPQLAIQRKGLDFTEPNGRHPSEVGKFDFAKAKDVITRWVTEYGYLWGGGEDRKMKIYLEILVKKLGFDYIRYGEQVLIKEKGKQDE